MTEPLSNLNRFRFADNMIRPRYWDDCQKASVDVVVTTDKDMEDHYRQCVDRGRYSHALHVTRRRRVERETGLGYIGRLKTITKGEAS